MENQKPVNTIQSRENLKIKILEDKLINNSIRWYRHILRLKKDRIPKKVLNTKLRGKYPRGVLRSKSKHKDRKYVTQKKDKCGKKQRKRRMRTVGKMETNGDVWLLEHPPKVEESKAEK